MSRDTNGIALVGRILAQVAADGPCKAADLARALGAGRTTVFTVLRDLESVGLLDRDAHGVVSPGQASGALGFASAGLAPLAGPAEALLPALRDDTDGQVELVVQEAGREIVLARRSPAGWSSPAAAGSDGTRALEASVDAGRGDVVLRLRLQPQAPPGEREAARCSLDAVAEALSRAGQPAPNRPGEP